MLGWLKNNFDIFVDEKGNENITWLTERDTIMMAKIIDVIDKFGDVQLNKEQMLEKASEGWIKIIERWDELGKFN